MAEIPFLSRLNWHDYQGLVVTLLFVSAEVILRVVFAILPLSLLQKWIFQPVLARLPKVRDEDTELFAGAQRASDLAAIWSYPFEEHMMETKDGYWLSLHRIPHGLEEDVETTVGVRPQRPVVLLWHGFMMNSEVFLCSPDRERNLAFVLADHGFDVWLGNTRGNKYSFKHYQRKPHSRDFWDYSLDELAAYDLPGAVDYILAETGAESLAYVGFSQGTAQAFASLSTHRRLNQQISLFIALAPATKPPGLENGVINSLVKSSPHFIYLLLGRRAALSSALFWRDVLPRRLYAAVLDAAVLFLFGWHARNISERQKTVCYAHLYSYSSTKTIAHWFQIIGARRFQAYDDKPPMRLGTNEHTSGLTHVAFTYPTQRIRTPIAIFHGGCDSLSNIHQLLPDLPKPKTVHRIDKFEHLDFLWADDANKLVWGQVVKLLKENAPKVYPN